MRDALLGIRNLDWDLATAAPPQEVRRLFRRTVPVGIEFGTVGVLDEDGRMHEVTTFRRDIRTDGRHAVVEFGASLDDDLARRDFTINAIAYSPATRELHDPFNGLGDLEAGIVRAVGDPSQRMVEDRLRALRAFRFASRFGFRIESSTWSAVLESAPHLGRLSPERVKQELEKTMDQVRCPSRALLMWRDSGSFATVVPPLADVSNDTLFAVDVHALPVGKRAGVRRLLRMATLFSRIGPAAARSALRQLRFSNAHVRGTGVIIEVWTGLHEDIARALGERADIPPAQLRRWVSAAGRLQVGAVLRLAESHWHVRRERGLPAPDALRVRSLYRAALTIAFRDPVELSDLAIGGDDLRAGGIPPGPEMAVVLRELLDEVLEDPARNTVETLMARARAIHSGLR